MAESIRNVSNNLNLVKVERPQAITRAERIEANNREIAKLENELSIRKDNINITKNLIDSNNETISILKQLKSNNNEMIASREKYLESLIESRDLHMQAREALVKVVEADDKMLDLMQQMLAVMEKMLVIMEKNPARYGRIQNLEVQKQPEVIEAKNQINELANNKVEQYPLNMHPDLKETTKKVIDATFSEIKPNNIQANRELFSNLSYRLEVALDKKYESLAVNKEDKNAKKNLVSYNRFLETFARIKRLAYLNLDIKNFKV
jgi:hypothetical protein